MSLPKDPQLISSPLHNERNIVDLDDIMKKQKSVSPILKVVSA